MDTEKVRVSYKPEKIKLLFIAESPPASGQFFYRRSMMTTYTSRAFAQVFNRSFDSATDFLNFFQKKDCYLEDMTSTPVNKMSAVDREKTIEMGISQLTEKIRVYIPEAIVIMLRKIERYAKKAITSAGVTCPVYTLPFPGNGNQNKFIHGLIVILHRHYLAKT
jgi:hypothetical protein